MMSKILISSVLHESDKSFNTFLTLTWSIEDRFPTVPTGINVFDQIVQVEAVLRRHGLNKGHRPPTAQPTDRFWGEAQVCGGFFGR